MSRVEHPKEVRPVRVMCLVAGDDILLPIDLAECWFPTLDLEGKALGHFRVCLEDRSVFTGISMMIIEMVRNH